MALLISEHDPSIEAIRFQADSKLPSELTAQFAKVFKFAADYDATYAHSDMVDKLLIKHTMIKDLLEGEIGTALRAITEHHTGFKFENVIAVMPTSSVSMFQLGVMFANGDDEYVFNKSRLATVGTGGHIDKNTHPGFIEEIMSISHNFDKNTGKLKHDIGLVGDLILPVGLFVPGDFITNVNTAHTLTAEEMAAIFLHELGHIFSMVECVGDMAYLGYCGNNILRDVTTQMKSHPAATIKEITVYTDKHLDKVTNKAHHMLLQHANVALKQIEVLLPEVRIDQADHKIYNRSWLEGVALTIGKLILMDFFAVMSIGLLPVPLAEIDAIDAKSSIGHGSRERGSLKNWSIYERLADEYVSRFKMSKELNSALIKLDQLSEEVDAFKGGLTHNRNIRDSKKLRILTSVIAGPCTLVNYLWGLRQDGTSEYESHKVRLQRNVANLIDVVKDTGIDKRIRGLIVKDIDDMEAVLNNHDSKQLVSTLDKVVKFIINLPDTSVKYGRSIFGSAAIDHDYFQLFEHLDTMLSNKSFYYSAKIAGIMGR